MFDHSRLLLGKAIAYLARTTESPAVPVEKLLPATIKTYEKRTDQVGSAASRRNRELIRTLALEFIKRNGIVNATDLASTVGLGADTVRLHLLGLIYDGKLPVQGVRTPPFAKSWRQSPRVVAMREQVLQVITDWTAEQSQPISSEELCSRVGIPYRRVVRILEILRAEGIINDRNLLLSVGK